MRYTLLPLLMACAGSPAPAPVAPTARPTTPNVTVVVQVPQAQLAQTQLAQTQTPQAQVAQTQAPQVQAPQAQLAQPQVQPHATAHVQVAPQATHQRNIVPAAATPPAPPATRGLPQGAWCAIHAFAAAPDDGLDPWAAENLTAPEHCFSGYTGTASVSGRYILHRNSGKDPAVIQSISPEIDACVLAWGASMDRTPMVEIFFGFGSPSTRSELTYPPPRPRNRASSFVLDPWGLERSR